MELNSNYYSVQYSEDIKELARTVVRMSRSSHPMLVDKYDEFVKLGKAAPSYALKELKHAECDLYSEMAKEMINQEMPMSEYVQKARQTASNLSNLRKSPYGTIMTVSMLLKYPESALKRLAIVAGLVECSNERALCSSGKRLKKYTYKSLVIADKIQNFKFGCKEFIGTVLKKAK